MTAYFAELGRRLAALPTTDRGRWLDAVAALERQAIHDVVKLLADEEFPRRLRDEIEAIIRREAVHTLQSKAWKFHRSFLIAALAAAFADLGRMRHPTRFGILTACPIDNAFRRAAYERQRPMPVAPAPAPVETMAAQLAELRERLKRHDDKCSPFYDEDHARKLRLEVQRLEQKDEDTTHG